MQEQSYTNTIPNIVLGQDYDRKYNDAIIHYDALEKLSHFFGHHMPAHRHAQYLQIHFINEGSVSFHIDDNIYQFTAPCCFLTPPSSAHSFHIENQATGHVLTVHQSLVAQLLKDGLQQQSAQEGILALGVAQNQLTVEEEKQWQFIKLTFEHIASEWKDERLAKQLTLDSLTRLLIIQLVRLVPNEQQKPLNSTKVAQTDIKLFNQFTELVELHYNEHWLLPKYLNKIGISDSRLNLICQRIVRHSPKKLIHNRLMLEIKRLLAFTQLSVNDICYQTGFADPAYFSRFFKKHAGKTANNYRKSQI